MHRLQDQHVWSRMNDRERAGDEVRKGGRARVKSKDFMEEIIN